MNRIYHWLSALFKRKRIIVKQDVSSLPANILAEIARESAFLKGEHAVEVRSMEEGEEGKKPHAVDPAVEAALALNSPQKAASTP
jgi:hypothetical protein